MEKNRFYYPEERKKEILRLLDEHDRIEVSSLIDLFNVSGSTIRADMRELESENKITRTHGGAIKVKSTSYELGLGDREVTKEKKAIAEYAVSLIRDRESIVIDTGTTCFAFATELVNSQLKGIRVLTYDLKIASLLSEQTDYEICIVGGIIRKNFQYTAGESVIEDLKSFSVDKAILATTTFNIDKGYATPNLGTAELKKSLLGVGSEVVMLCESYKIGKDSFKTFAKSNEIDILVTDKNINSKQIYKLKQENIIFTAV